MSIFLEMVHAYLIMPAAGQLSRFLVNLMCILGMEISGEHGLLGQQEGRSIWR